MAETQKAKLVIVGAGPGGYVAAIRAAQLGSGIVLVEKNLLGGICLNWGCIPTKALLACAEALETIRDAEEYGIKVADPVPDIKAMVERKEKISEQLRNGIAQLLKANKVEFIQGAASLASPGQVKVETEDGEKLIETEKVILATGSEPARLPTFDFDQPAILTSTEGLELTEIPKSMIIVGSGVVGSEFATIYNALGSKVCNAIQARTCIDFVQTMHHTFGHFSHSFLKKVASSSNHCRDPFLMLRRRGLEYLTLSPNSAVQSASKVLGYGNPGLLGGNIGQFWRCKTQHRS